MPPPPTAFLESLTYSESKYQGRRGTWKHTTQQHYSIAANGAAIIPAGSVARLEDELRNQGYQFCISDRTVLPLAAREHDQEFYDQLTEEQRRHCDLIIRHRQFVHVTTQATALEYMKLIARLYPKSPIFVVMPTLNDAAVAAVMEALAKKKDSSQEEDSPQEKAGPEEDDLLEEAIDGIGYARGLICDCAQRLALGSLAQFAASNQGEWPIVIFPNVERALNSTLMRGVGTYESNRLYAFVTPGATLSQRDRLMLEMVAGPILDDEQHVGGAVPMGTAMFCVSTSRPIRVPPNLLERKRVSLWHNEVRNGLVAEVAKAFANGDEDVLRSHFRVGDDGIFTAGAQMVVILVESPEHGRELQRLLPAEWELVTATNCNARPVLDSCPRRIITRSAANRLQNLIAGVLVRADGGQDAIQAPIAPTPLGSAPRRALLVDFLDDFESSFYVDSHWRALAYRNQGLDLKCPTWLLNLDPSEVNGTASATKRSRTRRRTRSAK
jgi:hypothetical protein